MSADKDRRNPRNNKVIEAEKSILKNSQTIINQANSVNNYKNNN